MDSAITNLFSKILPDRENARLLIEAMEIVKFREDVVSRLAWLEENDNGDFWWEDKILMDIFLTLHKSGCIELPHNPVERIRWIALLCAESSRIEGFSCGNIVIPPDYMPDEKLEDYEEHYGTAVIEAVEKFRKQLATRGWEATFGN